MDLEVVLTQTLFPGGAVADGAGVVEESQDFFLLGEVTEERVVGIVGGDERIFAVEDGGIGGGAVVAVAVGEGV